MIGELKRSLKKDKQYHFYVQHYGNLKMGLTEIWAFEKVSKRRIRLDSIHRITDMRHTLQCLTDWWNENGTN